MKTTILFNRDTTVTSICDDFNSYWRRLFLYTECNHIKDLLTVRGYVYLNQIYEQLYVKWDPKWDNPCCICNDGQTSFEFIIRDTPARDGFEIDISW